MQAGMWLSSPINDAFASQAAAQICQVQTMDCYADFGEIGLCIVSILTKLQVTDKLTTDTMMSFTSSNSRVRVRHRSSQKIALAYKAPPVQKQS